MWFKNVLVFQLQTPISYKPDELDRQLEEVRFRPCPKSHPHSYGFAQPIGDETYPLVFGQNGCMLIRMRIEEKVLPSSVVREQLNAKIKDLELKSGRRVYKDEKERIKDEVYQTLLTKAFTKSSYINGYIDTHKNWLVVDCASGKKLSQFVSMFMKATGNAVFAPEYQPVPHVLTKWLLNQQYPSNFIIGNACLLKDPEEKGSQVRVKNEDLFSDKIQAFAKDGSIATQINLQWGENVRFTIKEDFSLSSVKFLEAVKDLSRDGMSETVEERFASDFIIMTQTVQQLIDDLQPHFLKPKNEESVEEAEALEADA